MDAAWDAEIRSAAYRAASFVDERGGGRLELLAVGTDHVTFSLDGDRIVRSLRRPPADPDGTARQLDRETGLLRLLATVSPIPVPEPIGHDPFLAVSVTSRLDGTSLLDRPCPEPARLVEPLTSLMTALAQLPPSDVELLADPDPFPLDGYRAETAALLASVAPLLAPSARAAVDAFVATDPPPEAPAGVERLIHNDLGAEHLLVADDGVTLTGVMDWTDAAVADPARDLARLRRDLGPDVAGRVADGLADAGVGLDVGAEERALFMARCHLIEDLDHGLATDDHRYTRVALARLPAVFAPA